MNILSLAGRKALHIPSNFIATICYATKSQDGSFTIYFSFNVGEVVAKKVVDIVYNSNIIQQTSYSGDGHLKFKSLEEFFSKGWVLL